MFLQKLYRISIIAMQTSSQFYVCVCVRVCARRSSICLLKLIKGESAALASMDVFLMMWAAVNMQNATGAPISWRQLDYLIDFYPKWHQIWINIHILVCEGENMWCIVEVREMQRCVQWSVCLWEGAICEFSYFYFLVRSRTSFRLSTF